MHGEVDLAVAERALELGGEEALAADLGQRLPAVLRPVAGGGDHPRRALERRPSGRETRRDELGLCARERRGPRAECHRRGKRRGAH